jgi:hypothetical protein
VAARERDTCDRPARSSAARPARGPASMHRHSRRAPGNSDGRWHR